jgi:Cu-Zn family superoxide dismutase
MRFSIAATTLVASFLAGLAAADPIKAVAYIYGTTPAVSGWVSLTQDSYDAPTYIRANLTGLTPGKHGIHVHEFGDITNGCESTGVHFNPFNKVHGGPDDEIRHYGDFGNIDVGTDYYAILDLSSDMVKLSGENSALG